MSALRSLFVGKTTNDIIKSLEWGGRNKEDVLQEAAQFAASGKTEAEITAWGLERNLSYAEISVITASVVVKPVPTEEIVKDELPAVEQPIIEQPVVQPAPKKRGPAKGTPKKPAGHQTRSKAIPKKKK